MRWPKDETHRISLAIIVVFGLAGVVLHPLIFPANWDEGVLPEVGKAFLIAGILGFTIEPWLRRAFARDVFSAAFGYHMPDDFKQEIARISGYRTICIKHIMNVKIKTIDENHVSINVVIERTFHNIGSERHSFSASTWVDEWGISGNPSKIVRCEIFTQDGESKQFSPSKIQYFKNLSFRADSPPMILKRDGIATQITEYNVARTKNDFIYEQFMNPTRNAEINILEKPDDIEAEADFGSGHLKRTEIPGRFELDGVYFPPIPMKIRWWPKAAGEEWAARSSTRLSSTEN